MKLRDGFSGAHWTRRQFVARASAAAMGLRSGAARTQAVETVAPSTVVKAPCGVLRGDSFRGVRVFRGIPFAQPPVGPLRFRAPVATKPWSGERPATKFAAASMQPGANAPAMSEDCLYLNVYAPEGSAAGRLLPVFVWIHGGGNTSGWSYQQDGRKFARDGVVCVTVAYRLGAMGFLDMSPLLGAEYAGSANNAVRDLIMALQWVRDNIAAFGGDPGRVTIGGQSAGGKLTDTLLGTPAAEGLFAQATSESGGPERVWATEADAAALANAFGAAWKKSGRDVSALLTAPASAVLAVQETVEREWPHERPYRPMLDGVLLPKRPVDSMAAGSARGKRVLIGSNRDDSVSFVGPHPAEVTGKNLMSLSVEAFAPVAAKYAALYPEMSEEQRRIRAVTAEEYWLPSLRAADAASAGGAKVWMYMLTFREGSGRLGAFSYHSEEIPMVWDDPRTNVAKSAGEEKLAAAMHGAWVAFIGGAPPVGPGMPAWPQYDSVKRATMIFDTEMKVEEKPQEAEMRVWDGVM